MVTIDATKWGRIANVANEERTKRAFQYFSTHGIEPLLLKGWACSRFYDAGHIRTYTDVDIVCSPKSGDLALSLFREYQLPGFAIDMHIGMRNLDTLSWDELYRRSYSVELNGESIRVLSDEDNLRVTAVHWLTDGGVNREKLWDIYYLVKNRSKNFDWDRSLGSNGLIRRTWVEAAIATARDYLDLDMSGVPGDTRKFRLPKWYIRTLDKEWKRGPYSRRILSAVVTRPKLFAEQVYRRFPPNPVAATIDVEAPIDETWRAPIQFRSLYKKTGPFAKGIARRMSYRDRAE
jgi:hypothetical protein